MNDPTALIGPMAGQAIDLLVHAVERISPESWDHPSNLDGWSVRELIGHATGSAAKIVALVADQPLWAGPSKPQDWVCEDPAAKLRELATRLEEALPAADFDAMRTSPQGEVPLRRALTFPVSDVAIHSWDVQRSLGRPAELPEDLLGLCRALVESMPQEALRRPGGFGPAQPFPPDATPTSRLMAYLGRSVDGPG
jgi:uncharacterized protein (TIGR03086 family)